MQTKAHAFFEVLIYKMSGERPLAKWKNRKFVAGFDAFAIAPLAMASSSLRVQESI